MIKKMISASLIVVEQRLDPLVWVIEAALSGFRVANMAKARTAQAILGVKVEDMESYLKAVTLSYCMANSLSAMVNSSEPGIAAYLINHGISSDRITLWNKLLKTFNVPKGFAELLRQAYSPVQLSTGTLAVVLPTHAVEAVSFGAEGWSNPAVFFINSVYSTKLAPSIRNMFEDLSCLVTTDVEPEREFGYSTKGELAIEAGQHMGALGSLEKMSTIRGTEEPVELTKSTFFGGKSKDNSPLMNELLLQMYIQPSDELATVLLQDWWTETFSESEGIGKSFSKEK
jgi:hypothetical protein